MVGLRTWPVDALTKVFKDDPPGPSGEVEIESARNGFVNGQIAIRCEDDLELSSSCSSVQHGESGQRLQCMPRFVGYVHVRESVRDTPEEEILRPAPGEFPDYLMPENRIDVKAQRTQPLWLTIFVPQSSPPGDYRGSIAIKAGGEEIQAGIKLRVHQAAIPSRRTLHITNWLKPEPIAKFAGVEPWGEEHWRLLRAHAQSLSKHRQDTILTPLNLIGVRRIGGELHLDFSVFDRFIQTFRNAGVDGLIEGGHLAGRGDDWRSGFRLRSWQIDEGGRPIRQPALPVESDQCEGFISEFMPALQEHLEEKGWLECYVQHLADEPVDENADSYRHLAELVRVYAPRIRRIDANQTKSITGCLEVWVPVLDRFDKNMGFYGDRKRGGEDVWFYTCLGPRGRYPNRFIDFSLLKVRVLHWINFRYGLSGYLHWGYNYWTEDPFRDTQPDWSNNQPLPAGDMCLVYPGDDGPIESLRYEAMRDGIQDFELLKLLSGKDPERAEGICGRMVKSPTDYETDVAVFRSGISGLLNDLDSEIGVESLRQ